MVLGSMRSAGVKVNGTRGEHASGEPGGRTGIVFRLNISFVAVEFITPCFCHCPLQLDGGIPGAEAERQTDQCKHELRGAAAGSRENWT